MHIIIGTRNYVIIHKYRHLFYKYRDLHRFHLHSYHRHHISTAVRYNFHWNTESRSKDKCLIIENNLFCLTVVARVVLEEKHNLFILLYVML